MKFYTKLFVQNAENAVLSLTKAKKLSPSRANVINLTKIIEYCRGTACRVRKITATPLQLVGAAISRPQIEHEKKDLTQ